MKIFKKIAEFFAIEPARPDVHWEYVRCARCGEKIPVRVNLIGELTRQYGDEEKAYYVRKGVVGSGETRCYQTIEVELYFDRTYQLTSRYIEGGEFITREEFEVGE